MLLTSWQFGWRWNLLQLASLVRLVLSWTRLNRTIQTEFARSSIFEVTDPSPLFDDRTFKPRNRSVRCDRTPRLSCQHSPGRKTDPGRDLHDIPSTTARAAREAAVLVRPPPSHTSFFQRAQTTAPWAATCSGYYWNEKHLHSFMGAQLASFNSPACLLAFLSFFFNQKNTSLVCGHYFFFSFSFCFYSYQVPTGAVSSICI